MVHVHTMYMDSVCPPVLNIYIDMIKRRNLRTQNIKVLVLDEADEMLNKGVCCQGYKLTHHIIVRRLSGTDI